jgi:hypothetical protein
MMAGRDTTVALRVLLLATIALLVVFCLHIDYMTFVEFYGDGPPYYGGTTNMDKWHNPLPLLAIANLTALAVIGLIAKMLWRSHGVG